MVLSLKQKEAQEFVGAHRSEHRWADARPRKVRAGRGFADNGWKHHHGVLIVGLVESARLER